MIMTLDNWKTKITAKGIDPNEAMRLLQDAQAQVDALRAALRELTEGYRLLVNADNSLTRGAMVQFMDSAVIRTEQMLAEATQ